MAITKKTFSVVAAFITVLAAAILMCNTECLCCCGNRQNSKTNHSPDGYRLESRQHT